MIGLRDGGESITGGRGCGVESAREGTAGIGTVVFRPKLNGFFGGGTKFDTVPVGMVGTTARAVVETVETGDGTAGSA